MGREKWDGDRDPLGRDRGRIPSFFQWASFTAMVWSIALAGVAHPRECRRRRTVAEGGDEVKDSTMGWRGTLAGCDCAMASRFVLRRKEVEGDGKVRARGGAKGGGAKKRSPGGFVQTQFFSSHSARANRAADASRFDKESRGHEEWKNESEQQI
ncbi:uncharacterized protein N7482_009091 [Penicillium canariense]|uniref:Uncharacterized protein n=1 Tax=Penicillium canariense TaxID=189055 RepID=A0A9W9HM34_9EURO|nr:uncharacterized protein N7482_009091 [Penicillium canariense]KAJ5152613.1 hypothetical protein N7482_009091 [Penicillium canariense]